MIIILKNSTMSYVEHGSSGQAVEIDPTFNNPNYPATGGYFIGNDGNINQNSAWTSKPAVVSNPIYIDPAETSRIRFENMVRNIYASVVVFRNSAGVKISWALMNPVDGVLEVDVPANTSYMLVSRNVNTSGDDGGKKMRYYKILT